MLLYRYLNHSYAIDALQSGLLKVGRLLELNDPADCSPILKKAPDQGSEEANQTFTKGYLRELYRDFGLLSFSSEISDPVIWSHYADSHRGIALGYNFDPEKRGVPPLEVKYGNKRPVIDYEEAETWRKTTVDGVRFIYEIVNNAFTQKAQSWSYENEYRVFIWLEHCKMVGSHYFFSRLGGAPDKVVLGLRCPLTEADILRSVGPYRPQLEGNVVRARMGAEKYQLIVD